MSSSDGDAYNVKAGGDCAITDTVILAGNPNVGKSTLFNCLTGMRQHTGNWTGKTVGSAMGRCLIGGREKTIIDTPGTYSLSPDSADEYAAGECILSAACDAVVVVCDACSLERGLYLALQIMERRSNTILCVNLMDEAEKRGIKIRLEILEKELGIPVLGISAAKGSAAPLTNILCGKPFNEESAIIHRAYYSSPAALRARAGEICAMCVSSPGDESRTFRIDRLLCSRFFALPLMLALLFCVLWLSIVGANYPSELLSMLFAWIGKGLKAFVSSFSGPQWLDGLLIDGIYNTLAWVVSVMLPPMAIFFPLFSLMEDFGLLPRIAFNMDCVFRKCGGCGKQALTMCMGLGCNAAGVCSCRIIPGKRERLIAALTNSFMPCNGRFPGLILMSALLFPGGGIFLSALIMLSAVTLCVIISLAASRVLAAFLPGTDAGVFSLELPPFRRPGIISTLRRSFMERTFPVLLRAIIVSAPAGAVIWLLANIHIGESSILSHACVLLDGPGKLMGLNGAMLLGFILGLPANEIVLPVIMLCSLSGGGLSALPPTEELAAILPSLGWTKESFLCLMLFMLFHWPCATTLLTVKKECGAMRWMLLAAAIPTITGILLCSILSAIM